MRPVARLDRGAHGQRHLDGRNHPGGNPAARAQHRGRQRQSRAAGVAARYQPRRRGRFAGRVQRPGHAAPRPRERAETGMHGPAGEQVERPPESRHRRDVRGRGRRDDAPGLRRPRDPDGSGLPGGGQGCPARQEHVRARHAMPRLFPRPRYRARPGRVHLQA